MFLALVDDRFRVASNSKRLCYNRRVNDRTSRVAKRFAAENGYAQAFGPFFERKRRGPYLGRMASSDQRGSVEDGSREDSALIGFAGVKEDNLRVFVLEGFDIPMKALSAVGPFRSFLNKHEGFNS